MTKTLSYVEDKKVAAIVIISLVVSIIISSFFILFSPDPTIRNFNALLMSAISIGVAFVITLVQVFRYKKSIRKQRTISEIGNNKQSHLYYDNNKMHFSICLFFGLWLVAQLFWLSSFFPSFYFLSQFQPSIAESMTNVFFFSGYASFGYFLYSLYYHFFRKEFDPLVLALIGVVVAMFLVSILYLIVTGPWGQDDLIYPILDAILIFPAILIFLGVIRIRKRNAVEVETGQSSRDEEIKSSYPTVSSIWIMLLSVAMFLSAIGDTGYAYSTTLGPDILQRDVWIWNIIFNADHLCFAAALVGYRSFFSFIRIDTLQH
jgi:hypothetical protein